MIRSKPSIHIKVERLLGCPPGTILDMGSGNCDFAHRLQRMGWVVTMLDLNPVSEGVIRADLNYDTVPHFPKYDKVICIELLEHLENPFHAISQAYNVLKHGGVFILSTPYVNSLWQRLFFLFTGSFFRFDFVDHVSPMIEKKLFSGLKRAGFVVEKVMFNRGVIPLLRCETIPSRGWGDNIIVVCRKRSRVSCLKLCDTCTKVVKVGVGQCRVCIKYNARRMRIVLSSIEDRLIIYDNEITNKHSDKIIELIRKWKYE